jgi:hypothetical protein
MSFDTSVLHRVTGVRHSGRVIQIGPELYSHSGLIFLNIRTRLFIYIDKIMV